jgi:hypothetical protein
VINFSRQVVNKNIKQMNSKVLWPDNTEEGEENFPKIRTKEDLFCKYLWKHLMLNECNPKLLSLSNSK